MFKGKNTVLVSLLVLMFLASVGYFPALVTTATTQYVYLTVNIIGNGNLTIITLNNETVINKTTTFEVPAGYSAELISNQSFWLGKGTLITKIAELYIFNNTVLNVYFNVKNVTYPASEYTRVTVVDADRNLNLTISIYNQTFAFTGFFITNKSTTFIAPIHSVVLIGYNQSFYVNGKPTVEWPDHVYVYQYYINTTAPVTLTVTLATTTAVTTTNTTTTLPSTTIITMPIPNTTSTLVAHNGTTNLLTTTSHSLPVAYYVIIVIIIIILIALFIIRRVRK